jgi:DHA1 family tetracycline resistance protein-like MFS transporter
LGLGAACTIRRCAAGDLAKTATQSVKSRQNATLIAKPSTRDNTTRRASRRYALFPPQAIQYGTVRILGVSAFLPEAANVIRLLPILGITFIDILGFSILIPMLPYFVKSLHASDFTVGILFSAFAASQIIAGPFWGRLSDRAGRKRVLIVSQIGATVGWTLLAFAHSLSVVFIARIVEGASGGNISVTQAYVADLIEPAKRSRAFAYVGAAFSMGFVFGPLIGALLLRYGFAAPFLAAALLQLVTLALTIFMLPESRRPAAGPAASLTDIFASLRDKRISPVLWQLWMYSLSLYAWFAVIALVLRALGFSGIQTNYYFAAFGALGAVFQFSLVQPVSAAIGDRACSNAGIALTVLAFACVPFARGLLTITPTFVLFAAGMALARPSLTSLLTAPVLENQRGAILGLSSALDNLSGVVMPPLSTGLLGRYGTVSSGAPSLVFSTIALIMGISAQRRRWDVALAPEHASALTEPIS